MSVGLKTRTSDRRATDWRRKPPKKSVNVTDFGRALAGATTLAVRIARPGWCRNASGESLGQCPGRKPKGGAACLTGTFSDPGFARRPGHSALKSQTSEQPP